MKSPYPLSIVSGLLIGTSYIPFPPWAIFFCFIPLWLAWLKCDSIKQVFWSGWLAQFVLTLIGFNWVSYTVHEFGHLPWPFAIIVLMLFSGISTLSIPFAGAAWFWFTRRFAITGGARIYALVAFMCISERIFPMIFDWHFGYTWLWAKFPAYHLADVVGFIGLSNIGLLFNGFLLHGHVLFHHEKRPWTAWAPFIALPVVLFGALNLTGYLHAQNLKPADKTLGVLVVQANIGNEDKIAAEQGAGFRDAILERWLAGTQAGVLANPGKVDFAVWPETAFPEYIDDPNLLTGYAFKLKQRLTGLGIKLITGGYSHLSGTNRPTNSFFLLSSMGQWLAPPYHKTILLAFGEYFPGAQWFPQLRDWFPEVADFGRGPGPTVRDAEGLKVGAQICYEGLFDWFSRRLALGGAQIIVNLTNDSWYGSWQQPYQHLYMTLARAVEVRRPLVRATNTGISTVVTADGTVMERSPVYQEWQHLFEVPYASEPATTAFMTWGYYLIPTLLLLTLVCLPLLAFRRKEL